MSIITQSTDAPSNIERIAEWRPRFQRVKRGELGHPIAEIRSAAKALYLTEAAIECGIRHYAKSHGLTDRERAAAVSCALQSFRTGSSAAKAMSDGYERAGELAWGTKPGGAE